MITTILKRGSQMGNSKEGLRAVYTVTEAAEILGIGRSLAYIGIREGWLPAIRLGQRLVVPHQAIEAMLASAMPTNWQPEWDMDDV
jgi:excisionase family DNA binding protein